MIYLRRPASLCFSRCASPAGCMNPVESSGQLVRRFNHVTSTPQPQSTRRRQTQRRSAARGVREPCKAARKTARWSLEHVQTIAEGRGTMNRNRCDVRLPAREICLRGPLLDRVPRCCHALMELSAVLEACGATWNLLPFLRWRDVISVASASTRLFLPLRNACRRLRADVSCGDSPHPIPCDPVRYPVLSVQQVPPPPGYSAGVSRRSEWSLGGPVPPSFSYLNSATHDFEDAEDLLEGCGCFGGCDVGNSSCPCVQLNVAVESDAVPLFECHTDCSCAPTCRLRATQRGPSKNIRLRYMGSKGWGAYAVHAIPGGAYVADYTGEVLSVLEARRRIPAYDKDGLNYVLTTQEFFQGGRQVCQTIVDATASGNVSRFFNHSCEPTLSVFVIRRGSFQRPRLAFFTRDQVEAGRELTYDYGATGAAGGAASEVCDRESDENSGTLRQQQQLPTTKPPRKSGAQVQVESTSSGELPQETHGVLPVEDNDASEVGKTGEMGRQPWTARGSDGGEGSDHGVALSARRACLCGSRRCRGLLPCDRAIL